MDSPPKSVSSRPNAPRLPAADAWKPCFTPAASGAICPPAAFAEIVARLPGATPPVRSMLQQRLRAPDGISWAPVGRGLALPHLRTPIALGREAGIFAILFLREALALNEPAPDDQPVIRLLFFVAPSPRAHLEMLAQLSTSLSRGDLGRRLDPQMVDAEIFAAIASAENAGRKAGEL